MKSLVLFSNDLRLNDNDAINASAINGITSTFVFVYDEKLYVETHGSANLWWLEKSLTNLQSRLADKDIKLHILDGDLVSTVTKIVKKYSFEALYLNRNKHPSFLRAEDHIEKNLKKGYAILKSENQIIKSIQTLKKLNNFDVTLKDGVMNVKKKL